jgi:hypothetical protein
MPQPEKQNTRKSFQGMKFMHQHEMNFQEEELDVLTLTSTLQPA